MMMMVKLVIVRMMRMMRKIFVVCKEDESEVMMLEGLALRGYSQEK